MKHEKSPQFRAGYLRGCKSGYRYIIISDSNIKNNIPIGKNTSPCRRVRV